MRKLSGSASVLAALFLNASSLASVWIDLNSNSIFENPEVLPILSVGTIGGSLNITSPILTVAPVIPELSQIRPIEIVPPPAFSLPVIPQPPATTPLPPLVEVGGVTEGSLWVGGPSSSGSYNLTLGGSLSLVHSGSGSVIVIGPPIYNPPPIILPPPPPVVPPPPPPPLEPPVITPPNNPPVAAGLNLVHGGWSPLEIAMADAAADADGDPLTFAIKTPPAFGEVHLPTGFIVYASALSYVEGDTFTLQVSDGRGGIAESTVVLTNPFANRDGTYFGFLPGRGSLRATFDRFGVGTFQLRVDGLNASDTFILKSNGTTEVSLPIGPAPGTQVTVTFELVPTEPPVLKVVVAGVRETGAIECQRKTNTEIAAQYAGQYNVELAAVSDSLKSPFGFVILNVKQNGNVVATGRLPNGKPWSSGGAVDEMGDLHVGMASRKGQAVIDGNISLPVIRGNFDWFRPNGTVQLRATGGRFEPQTEKGRNVFGGLSTRAFFSIGSPALSKKMTTISYLDGFSTAAVARTTTPIRIDGQDRVAQLATVPPLINLSIKSDGRFSGTYVSPKASQFLHFTGILQSSGVRGLGVITDGPGGYVTIDLTSPNQPDSSGVIITTVGSSRSAR